jgi:hypothetical protein
MADGNFLWSAQLATFGLFAAHATVLAGRWSIDRPRQHWRLLMPAAVLGLHALYGVWWVMGRVPPSRWWLSIAAPPALVVFDLLMRRRTRLKTVGTAPSG